MIVKVMDMIQTRDWARGQRFGVRDSQSDATRWLLLAVVSVAQFLAAFDLWVVTIALPTLRREFAPAELSDVGWILSVYTIVLAACMTPAGRIADTLGRKRAFLIALVAFGVASAGCGLAPTLPVMIAWRSLQGLSAALLLPTSLGLALPAFAPEERGAAIGIWAAVGALAAGSGPVLGGLLIQISWRWIFLINVPIVLVAVAAGSVLVPRDTLVRAAAKLDGVGLVLVLGSTGLVCAALIEATAWPALLIGAMLGSGLCLAALFIVHAAHHPEPLVPPRLFRVRRFTVSAVGLFVYYMGFAVNLLGLTVLLTEGMHLSVLGAALGMAPGPISAGLASPFSSRITARLGVRPTLVLGATLFALAAVWPLVATSDVPVYLSNVLPSLVCWGVANALIQPTLFAGADAAPKDDLALAAAVLGAARQLGSALGVALLVAVVSASGLSVFMGGWEIVLASAVLTGLLAVVGVRAPGGAHAVVHDVPGWRT
jgi:EmrB/QacA subfamily drug resistance transporter